MGKFSSEEIESQYNLIKMLLAETEKYRDAINVMQRDIPYLPIGLKKLDEKKLYNAGTFQIIGSALNICPESIPKNIKNDYEKRLKQLVKQSKK